MIAGKTDEAAVEVDTVIENLHANSAMAKQIIRAAVAAIPETPDGPCHRVLDTAIFTARAAWPEKTAQGSRADPRALRLIVRRTRSAVAMKGRDLRESAFPSAHWLGD